MTEEDKKDIYQYAGDQVDVFWDERLCIHVGECGRAEGELFVDGRDPWCQPNLVQLGDAPKVIQRCPTGALTYRTEDGDTEKVPAEENTVVVAGDGPLYVQGALTIDGAASDMGGVKFRAALCRCGHSKNKPFCDNSHVEARFRDSGAVGKSGDATAVSGGPLAFKNATNGPLLVEGNFAIISGSGRRAWTGTKAALCRCGASKNKPFCDGSHVAAEFKSD